MRLIDADALLDEVMDRHCNDCDRRKGNRIKDGKYGFIYAVGDAPCRACEVDDFKDQIEDAPTIEFEIIHCKDCRYFKDITSIHGECESADMWQSLFGEVTEVEAIEVHKDHYCGYAERKTNE